MFYLSEYKDDGLMNQRNRLIHICIINIRYKKSFRRFAYISMYHPYIFEVLNVPIAYRLESHIFRTDLRNVYRSVHQWSEGKNRGGHFLHTANLSLCFLSLEINKLKGMIDGQSSIISITRSIMICTPSTMMDSFRLCALVRSCFNLSMMGSLCNWKRQYYGKSRQWQLRGT